MNADNSPPPIAGLLPSPPSSALQRTQVVRDYEKHFAEATGLPLKFAPREIPDTSGPFEIDGAPFCGLLARHVDSCAFCQKIHAALQERASDANHPTCASCFAAMEIAAVPVIVSGENLGSLVAGQVHLEKPTKAHFSKLVQQLLRFGLQPELSALEDAWFHTRVLSREQFDASVGLLSIFARHLSEFAGPLTLAKLDTDPPAVALAREFLDQHLAEPIHMPDAARHVHLSATYFCKMFKQTTGMTFTECLTRARVEKAKRLLADPNRRVTEVVYESGFESIPHFNRVFKRHTGLPPTSYRASLRG